MTTLRWIDTSSPRIWTVSLPAQYTADELIEEFGQAMEALRRLPTGHRLAVFTDLSRAFHSDSRRRQRVAKFMSENRILIGRRVVAWGFVAHGIMRGTLTALSWVRAFPVPMRVFGNRRECEAWLEERLAKDSPGGQVAE